MSSFYDDASLVVIPSGYKTSKVYAEKPTDGSGDLAFTRTGDTATRVNSAGLIEKVRTNLVLQSETFNTTWSASRGAVTANATTAPNGTTTADKFVPDTQVNPHFISQSIASLTNGGIYTSSVYAKAGEWNSIAIFRFDSAIGVSFRLDTQAMTVLAGSPVTYSITDAGNGWYRCSMSFAIASTSDGAQFRIGNNGGYSIAGNNANGLFLWGAQYETTDFGATPYIPTTSAAVSVGPVANVPRLDYLASTCPRLLLEPQRTNLLQFSEQIDNAYWTKQDTSITANTSVSPDGYTNADSLIENSATAQHLVMRTGITITNATAYTASVYFKANTRTRAAIQLAGAGFFDTANGLVIFNLSTGTIVSQSGNATGTITAMGNGWYRCTATKTSVGTNGVVAFNLVDSSNNISYAGNGTSGVFLWGAQFEASAYPTSYVPTLAASATRGADACSKTGISSLIGQSEGWIYGEVEGLTNSYGTKSVILSVNDGSNLNRVELSFNASTGFLTPRIYKAGSTIFVTDYFKDTLTTKFKFAIGYGGGRAVFYVNGTKIHEVTSLTFFTAGTLTKMGADNYNGGEAGFGRVSSYLIGTANLTNAELATLTTL